MGSGSGGGSRAGPRNPDTGATYSGSTRRGSIFAQGRGPAIGNRRGSRQGSRAPFRGGTNRRQAQFRGSRRVRAARPGAPV